MRYLALLGIWTFSITVCTFPKLQYCLRGEWVAVRSRINSAKFRETFGAYCCCWLVFVPSFLNSNRFWKSIKDIEFLFIFEDTIKVLIRQIPKLIMSYKICYLVLRDLSKPIAVQHESKKEKYMQTYGVGSFELSTFISFVHHYYPKPSLPLRALSFICQYK